MKAFVGFSEQKKQFSGLPLLNLIVKNELFYIRKVRYICQMNIKTGVNFLLSVIFAITYRNTELYANRLQHSHLLNTS